MKIAVTSRSFSKNEYLRNYLKKKYKNCIFNDSGNLLSKKENLIKFLVDADAAIVGLDIIDKSILKNLPKLKVISKYGVGLNNLDLIEMRSKKISLGYSEGVNKHSVAELTLAASILLRHKAVIGQSIVRYKEWRQIIGNEIKNCKFGIIGLGNVGSTLVDLLKPFGCEISYYDTNKKIINDNAQKKTLKKLLKESDIISLHIPLNKSNLNFFDRQKINFMKKNSIFLNFSRGGLVDEKFLLKRYKNGFLSGLGFDVLRDEPVVNINLLKDNIFITPHMGGSSEEAIINMGKMAVINLKKAEIPSKNFIKYYSIK